MSEFDVKYREDINLHYKAIEAVEKVLIIGAAFLFDKDRGLITLAFRSLATYILVHLYAKTSKLAQIRDNKIEEINKIMEKAKENVENETLKNIKDLTKNLSDEYSSLSLNENVLASLVNMENLSKVANEATFLDAIRKADEEMARDHKEKTKLFDSSKLKSTKDTVKVKMDTYRVVDLDKSGYLSKHLGKIEDLYFEKIKDYIVSSANDKQLASKFVQEKEALIRKAIVKPIIKEFAIVSYSSYIKKQISNIEFLAAKFLERSAKKFVPYIAQKSIEVGIDLSASLENYKSLTKTDIKNTRDSLMQALEKELRVFRNNGIDVVAFNIDITDATKAKVSLIIHSNTNDPVLLRQRLMNVLAEMGVSEELRDRLKNLGVYELQEKILGITASRIDNSFIEYMFNKQTGLINNTSLEQINVEFKGIGKMQDIFGKIISKVNEGLTGENSDLRKIKAEINENSIVFKSRYVGEKIDMRAVIKYMELLKDEIDTELMKKNLKTIDTNLFYNTIARNIKKLGKDKTHATITFDRQNEVTKVIGNLLKEMSREKAQVSYEKEK